MSALINPKLAEMLAELDNRLPSGTGNISALALREVLIPIIEKAWAVLTNVPFAPTALVAVAGVGKVTLTATPPANSGSVVIPDYQIFRNGEALPIQPNGVLPYEDTTVTNGFPYYYELIANSTNGNSVKSAQSNTATPFNAVITYSYVTTDLDFRIRCGANTSGAPVIGSSTVSLADAKAQAIAAIVCPIVIVVTYSATPQTYATTAQDYATKCPNSPAGLSVQRTSSNGSSTSSSWAANAMAMADAKEQAIGAIICSVSTPTVSTATFTAA